MKSALALLTLVCLTMHACALASVAVTTPSAGFLCSEDGTLLTEADAYSAVTPLGDSGLFSCVRPDGGIIICDSDGKTLSDDEYTGASYAYGRLVVSRGGLSALFDLEMNALTGWDFTHILPVSSSRFFAFRTNIYDDKADAIYLLLPDGRACPRAYRWRTRLSLSLTRETRRRSPLSRGCTVISTKTATGDF